MIKSTLIALIIFNAMILASESIESKTKTQTNPIAKQSAQTTSITSQKNTINQVEKPQHTKSAINQSNNGPSKKSPSNSF